jgi:hypothetical protein
MNEGYDEVGDLTVAMGAAERMLDARRVAWVTSDMVAAAASLVAQRNMRTIAVGLRTLNAALPQIIELSASHNASATPTTAPKKRKGRNP